MNNKGIGSGLVIALILIVALIIAFLAVNNMRSTTSPTETNYVQQAQSVVDKVNEAQRTVEGE